MMQRYDKEGVMPASRGAQVNCLEACSNIAYQSLHARRNHSASDGYVSMLLDVLSTTQLNNSHVEMIVTVASNTIGVSRMLTHVVY